LHGFACAGPERIDITAHYGERVRTQHIARVLLLSTLVVFLTGCQILSPVGDFISQRYINTASYFNTYYNAEKMFDDAETEVLTGIQAAREKTAKGQTTVYVISSTARQKFTGSIEKNSKMLSYYPTSKFVDNALLMIGKSYFYLEEDVKAERKFLELIAQYPESKLIPETKLWYGKSLLRQKRYAEGVQLLSTLYTDALQNGTKDIAGLAALTIGEYYFGLADYDNALQFYSQSISALSDDEENARTQLQIGLCYNRLNKITEAETAFRAVSDYSPDYNTAFQAAVYECRMKTRLKKYEPAQQLLFKKLDDSKFTEYFGAAHRELGNVFAAEGNITEAVAEYRYVDTAFARTDDAARSMFALASIYDTTLTLFDSARTYYDKAKIEFPTSEVTLKAAAKADIFGKYFGLKRDLAVYDTLIMDTEHPRPKKIDSLKAGPGEKKLGTFTPTPVPRLDTALARATARRDSATAMADTLARTPAARAAVAARRDSLARVDSIKAIAAAATAKVQRLDSLQRQVIRTKFELAALMYLDMNRPDSALLYYNEVVQLTKDSSLAARAYFTIAEIITSSDSLSRSKSDSIYRKIIQIAPQSSYAQEARKNLGIPLLKEERDSAEVHYWDAERYIDRGKPEEAIPLLRMLAATYPASPYSPKALYTVGWLYENSLLLNDSAETAYKFLVEQYPNSTYTLKIKPKLAEITNAQHEAELKAKLEKEAKEKAEAEIKAKAEIEAKKKAEAEKLKASDQIPPGASAGRDSAGTKMPLDSTAVKLKGIEVPENHRTDTTGVPGSKQLNSPVAPADTNRTKTKPMAE
jgi:TolA-binding protein